MNKNKKFTKPVRSFSLTHVHSRRQCSVRRLSSLTCLRQTQQGLSPKMWMRAVQQTDLHCKLTGLNVLRGLSGKPEPGCLNSEADWATFGHFEVSNYLIHDWHKRGGRRSSCSRAAAAIWNRASASWDFIRLLVQMRNVNSFSNTWNSLTYSCTSFSLFFFWLFFKKSNQ